MIDPMHVSRILVISLTNIGDAIMTMPVLGVLRAQFEKARIDLVVGPAPFELFRGSPDLAHCFAYDKKWSWSKQWQWVQKLAKEKYDLVVDLRHTLIPILVGARYRTKLIRLKRSGTVSVRDRHLELLKEIGIDVSQKKSIRLSGGEARRFPGPYCVIAPGANSSTKRWTVEGFERVIRYLSDEAKLKVVLAGNESWPGKLGGDVVDLTGRTTLAELVGLVSHARLVVANDSAVMQLAGELDVPCVAIFGPTNPWKYAPKEAKVVRRELDCSPCEAAQCRLERRICLDDLPAEQVIGVVKEIKNESPLLRGVSARGGRGV